MSDTITLSVGDDYRVAGLVQGRIAYGGMPSEDVYSLIHKKEIGASYAYNLFYLRSRRDITIGGISLFVQNVTPDEITFQIERTHSSTAVIPSVEASAR